MNSMKLSKSDRARAGATPEFVELCKTLYGDVVDPDAIWDDVIKLSPDQADVNAKGQQKKLRPRGRTAAENVALATNTAGVVAAPAAIYGAARSWKNNQGGVPRDVASWAARRKEGRTGRPSKVGNAVRTLNAKTGRKGKVGAALAGGAAVGLQGANAAGDAISAQHFARPKREETSKRLVPVRHIEPVGKAGAADLPDMGKLVNGIRSGWHKMAQSQPQTAPAAARTSAGRGSTSSGRASRPSSGSAGPRSRAAQPAGGGSTPAVRPRPASSSNAGGSRSGNQISDAVGQDIGRMLSTRSGAALTAGAGVAGLSAARPKRQDPYAAYYGKADQGEVVWEGEFTKFDDDKQLAFGWASVVEINGEPVVDKQGDWISPDDLEEAAYTYVHKSRAGGNMHRRNGEAVHKVSDLVESIVFTDDKVAKLGLPEDFPRGWWVGYKVHDPETWDMVRKGERTGFSIHGKGIRKEHSLDELMGYA